MQMAPQVGILGRVNNGMTDALKAYPVPVSILGVGVGMALYEGVGKPVGIKIGGAAKKGIVYVFQGGQQAAVETVGGEAAKQAVGAAAQGLSMYAQALPRVIVEDTAQALVKETGKNLVGGMGGGVWQVIANMFKALAA
jgi:hypothetical protein